MNKHTKLFSICLVAVTIILGNMAHAESEGYAQLIRNSTLESVNLDKTLLRAQNLGVKKQLGDTEIHKKAKELEAVFLAKMIEPMFPEGKESDLYGGGVGSDIFRAMMIQQYGQTLENAGGIGLAKGIEKQIR
jgi:Rod binding domain-containing protein